MNMAVDEALRISVRPDEGSWRWYAWDVPTVSFGRNERIVGRITPQALAESGLGAVRRPTGGRALLHHRELTYCVTVPLAAHVPWRAAYDAVNAVLFDALRAAGVPVELAAGGGALAPDGPVCFDQPAAGELVVHGRKLVGSAVWRQGATYLQHGSILLHDDQQLLHTLSPSTPPAPPAATLAECFVGLSDQEMGRRICLAVRETLQAGGELRVRGEPQEATWPPVVASQHRHFSDPAWLWRR